MFSGSPTTIRSTPSFAMTCSIARSAACCGDVTCSTSYGVANRPPSSLSASPTRRVPRSIASVRIGVH